MSEQRAIATTIATGFVAIAISGCGLFVSESEISEPLPQQPAAEAEPAAEATPTPAIVPSPITALTPPTNPKEYVAGLSDTGRSNPFEPVPVPGTGTPGGNGNGATGGTSGTGGAGGSATLPPPPPPPPPPVDAQAVQVFGVAAINGRLQAVIRSPKENVTRTVQVGDTIAGTVLVRSIDAYETVPAVILEQFGQTVRVPVGKPTTAQAGQPATI
ncbi:hypothetical protein [Parathermosynechococcus lividus]|jgi:hypothetical protein|nr:hypothetical protein [Synechococcus sp. PCC 6716]